MASAKVNGEPVNANGQTIQGVKWNSSNLNVADQHLTAGPVDGFFSRPSVSRSGVVAPAEIPSSVCILRNTRQIS